MVRVLVFLLLTAIAAPSADVYYLLWFDTEDYLDPKADEAAKQLALGLAERGVRGTFKIVGEKARVLERRNRRDVIAAMSLHDIGYHSENHSIPPQPALYLSKHGWLDGIEEFARREGPGVDDMKRIFGTDPSCYGQPGNSWGPQSNPALRRMGIRVYMDEARQIGLPSQQPFWYGGLLHVFNLRQFSVRTELNDPAKVPEAKAKFDAAVAELQKRGGGVIQTYYHPTEFVATEFWDGVNFRHGANPAPEQYRLPKSRTAESSAQAYRLFFDFVDHVRKTKGVRIVTAREILQLVETEPAKTTGRKLADQIDIDGDASAADQLLVLLGISPRHVDGPAQRSATTLKSTEIERWAFERAKADAKDFITRHGRLPDHVWIGPETLALPDFAATLAADTRSGPVLVKRGQLAIEKYVAKDPRKSYDWVIHPETFAPESLLEMARLQAWTLRPARLRFP